METKLKYPPFIFVRERDNGYKWIKYEVSYNKRLNPIIDKANGKQNPSLLTLHVWRSAICENCCNHIENPPEVKCNSCKSKIVKLERTELLKNMTSAKACKIIQCEPAREILKYIDEHSFMSFDYELAKHLVVSQETVYHKLSLISKPSIVVGYAIYWAGIFTKDDSYPFYSKETIEYQMKQVGYPISMVSSTEYIQVYKKILRKNIRKKDIKVRVKKYNRSYPFKKEWIGENHYIVKTKPIY